MSWLDDINIVIWGGESGKDRFSKGVKGILGGGNQRVDNGVTGGIGRMGSGGDVDLGGLVFLVFGGGLLEVLRYIRFFRNWKVIFVVVLGEY